MLLRAVAVGFVLAPSVLGCVRSETTPLRPTIVVVDGVVGSGPAISPFEAPDHSGTWSPRDEVEVEWQGSWWPAVVMEKRGARWLVHYEGYTDDWDEVVAGERIRERRIQPEPAQPADSDDETDP